MGKGGGMGEARMGDGGDELGLRRVVHLLPKWAK